MGEKKWKEYQKERSRKKSKHWYEETGKYCTSWRIRTKQKLVEYKGGRCEQCGYDKDVPAAYAFHHRDPSQKDFGISTYKVLNLDKLKKEADKCDLLCVRCHAELHDADNKEKRDKLIESFHKRKLNLSIIKCQGCNNEFKQSKLHQLYCTHGCFTSHTCKVKNRPSKDKLSKMMESMTWVAMGKKYGVSDNAVRKWARKDGLL